MTTRVALDTSALMMPVELDVRLFDELGRLLGGQPITSANATETAAETTTGAEVGDGSEAANGSEAVNGSEAANGSEAVNGSEAATGAEADETTDITRGSNGDAETIGGRRGGYEATIPQPVVEELRRLAEKGGTEGTAANVGHDLATERCLVVDTEAAYADDALVELAESGVVDYVVTNDRPLRERVLDAGIPVIALRGRNKLAITQP